MSDDELRDWRHQEIKTAIGVSVLALVTSLCIAAIAIYGGVW